MNRCSRLIPALLSLPLLACNGTSPAATAGVPALLVEPTSASRAEVTAAAAKLLHQQTVVLADDAFTATSTLALERSQLLGREMTPPEHLQLMLDGKGCYLLQPSTAQTARLHDTRCRAESP